MADNHLKSLPTDDNTGTGHPNPELLLAKLENRIIGGVEADRISGILKNDRLWRQLDPEARMRLRIPGR